MIGAAGNGYSHITMPASFPELIAVGAYDVSLNRASEISDYVEAPAGRFVLAPGGGKDSASAFGFSQSASFNRSSMLYGTSFAAPFVTGVASRYVCGLKGGPCSGGAKAAAGSTLDNYLREKLDKDADRSWNGYTSEKYGMGLLRYIA
jgi:hypothetical protein